MALPMLRGCSRFPSTVSFTRLFLKERIFLNRPVPRRLPPCLPAGAAAVRPYGSDQGGERQTQKVVVFGLPTPLMWFRARVYYFLIRTYFDNDFSIGEFKEGAKQAFCHVSRLLSQCQFEDLEGLVAKDLIGKLQEKCNLLPLSHKQALSADPNEIMHSTPGDVGIYYDDDGRKFVCILMRFWYLTSANLPDDTIEGTRFFKLDVGEEGDEEQKSLLTANYEFQREFTKGVPPDWTITRIEHSKLLD